MAKKKKQKPTTPLKEEWVEKIAEQKTTSPEHVDWKLCAEAVDGLYEWIDELCAENHKLKQLINRTITKIKEDNENTKDILKSLEPKYKQLIPNKENQDHE